MRAGPEALRPEGVTQAHHVGRVACRASMEALGAP